MTVAVSTDPALVLRPLRRVEYEALVEAGLLADDTVELLEGALVEVQSQGGPHLYMVSRLLRLLNRELPDGWEAHPASPYVADDESEPEPDVAVVPWSTDGALPDTAALVIEVSQTSLAKDLGVKAGIYARSRVDEYWVIDMVAGLVHVHTRPRDGRWSSVVARSMSDEVTVLGVRVVPATLLPRPRRVD